MGSLEKRISSAVLGMIRSRRNGSAAAQTEVESSGTVTPAKLREARFSDFQGVSELKQRWNMHADSPENWERLWRNNPAQRANGIERPIGWVLEADGTIVGYIGNISLLYRYDGKTLNAVTAHGLVVDTPYRAMCITLVAAFFRQKNVDLFVSNSAVEATGKIALAFKSSPVPQPDYDTALFWVLRPHAFARVLMQKLDVNPTLARIGAITGGIAVGTDKLVRRRWAKTKSRDLSIREINPSQIGSEFNRLWNEKQEEGRLLLADRSSAALRWHFEIPGDRGGALVICCRRAEKLVGYAIVRNDTNAQTGLRSSIVADLIAKNDNPEIVQALLAAAYAHAKNSGSDILEMLGFPPAIRNVAAQWNPYRRKYPACPYYYKASDPELHKTLADGALWYASPFDGDATLIRPSYSPFPSKKPNTQAGPASNQAVFKIFEHQHSEVL
jgi:hypothetical protein